jgi:hypothetical protein
MFPIKYLPLFAIGCATLPDAPGEVQTEPTNDPVAETFEPEDFDLMDSGEVRAAVWEAFFALQDLEIVAVGDVILDLPDEAICAYGWSACPGFEEEVDNALRKVAPRITGLVHFAQFAADEEAAPQGDTCSDSIIEANLDALADLEIIQVNALLVETPERNCPYNLPCEEDVAIAEQITCDRAAALGRIVETTREL